MKNLRLIVFLIGSLLFSPSFFSVLNYNMVVSTPGFVPLGVGKTTIPNFNWICGDQMVSSPLPIGFTFQYDGTGYTQFEISDNGQLFLGAPGISCSSNCGPSCTFPNGIEPNNLSSGVDRPAICPLWDDHGFNASGSQCNYMTTGVAPNRTLTVEWLVVSWKYNNTNSPQGSISFQVKLHESPAGQIDFIYRQDAQLLGTSTQSPSASIGLMGASGDYYSTNNTGSAISKVSQTSITQKPVNGVQYRWTQIGGLPIELVSFEGKIKETTALLEWNTASEKNNESFTVERSKDGLKYESAGEVKAAGNSQHNNQYSFVDDLSAFGQNNVYYRLKQTDYDKTVSYSEPIHLELILPEKAPLLYFDNGGSDLFVSYHFEKPQNVVLQICDMTGKEVFRNTFYSLSGTNRISVPIPGEFEGVYFARISDPSAQFTSQLKFLKN